MSNEKDGSQVVQRKPGDSGLDTTAHEDGGGEKGAEVELEVEMDAGQGATMQRTMGLVGGSSLIIGSIIGSGIFVSPKGVLANSGSVAVSLLVWCFSGAIALMGALCYSELGTMMGKSGGEYQYIREAYGNAAAYLFAWTSVIVIRPSSIAIISLTFGEYTTTILDVCGTPVFLTKVITGAVIVTVCALNSFSNILAVRVQVVFTSAKILALCVIIVGGAVRLAQGYTSVLETGFEGTIENPTTVSFAFYSALWAFDGWNNLNYVVEELKRPEKNLLRANALAVAVVTTVYILTNVSYLTAMTTDGLLSSPAVAVTWGDTVLTGASILIPIFVMASTFGAANATLFTGGRVLYAASRHGNLPPVLSYIHHSQLTPVPSMIFTTILSLLMIIPSDIASLIDFFSFTAWLFYCLTFLSLIIFRFRTKWRHAKRVYKVPLVIPVVMVLVSLYLVIAPIVDDPKMEFLYAFLFILGGLFFYVPFIACKVQAKFYDHVAIFIQLVMKVIPSRVDD